MDRQGKEYQDEMTVAKYREQLGKELKVYMQKASARAINNRRARALAIGECALKIMDGVRECSKTHWLMPGSLMYMIDEKVIYPTADKERKEFEYDVMYQVTSNEKAYTEEEIDAKCRELAEKLKAETDEMYPEGEEMDTSSGADAPPSPQGEGLDNVGAGAPPSPQGEGLVNVVGADA